MNPTRRSMSVPTRLCEWSAAILDAAAFDFDAARKKANDRRTFFGSVDRKIERALKRGDLRTALTLARAADINT